MKTYSVGIYSEEYLILLEFITLLEKQAPSASIKVFGNEELLENLPGEMTDYVSQDLDGLLETNIVVLLSKLSENNIFKNYDGTVIDASGENAAIDYDDVIKLPDPMLAMLADIAAVNEDLHIVLDLPVSVYGKDGVNTLMQETRSVYTFEQFESSVLPMRIAFNRHFYINYPPHCNLSNELNNLKKIVSGLSLRISPVSTVFVADLFTPESLILPEGLSYYTPEMDFSLEDVSTQAGCFIAITADGKHCAITGDYLHMKTNAIAGAVIDAMGGEG